MKKVFYHAVFFKRQSTERAMATSPLNIVKVSNIVNPNFQSIGYYNITLIPYKKSNNNIKNSLNIINK